MFKNWQLVLMMILSFTLPYVACSGDDDDDTAADDDDTAADDDDTAADDDDTAADDDDSTSGTLPTGGFSGVDNGDGTITDETTGLIWQKALKSAYLDTPLADAQTYCDELDVGGYTDWRLPNLEEMRSLVIGCDAAMLGGDCNAGENCGPDHDTCFAGCEGCEWGSGPGKDGYYYDEMLGGAPMYSKSWTTTVCDYGNKGMTLTVDFMSGGLAEFAKDNAKLNVRCIRKP